MSVLEGIIMSEIYIVKDCCDNKLVAIFTNEDDCNAFMDIDMEPWMYTKIELVI